MKKIIILFVILFLFSINNYSQSGWVRVSDSIPNLQIMAIQFTSAYTGYAVGSYGEIWPGGFLKTTNAGLNWQFTNFPSYSADDVCFLNDFTGYISSWSFNTYKSYILKTTNGGINWIPKDSLPVMFFKMQFSDVNTGIVTSKYSIAHKTTNGGNNWVQLSGMNWQEPNCIWCFDANNWIVTCKTYTLNKTTNGGANWNVLNFANIGFKSYYVYFINSNTGFGSTNSENIFKTTNKGDNWVKIDSIGGFYSNGNLFFLNENTGYICGDGLYNNIYKTTNGGHNWFANSNISLQKTITYLYFTNANTGYAGDRDGIIYKTTTGGCVFANNISTEIPHKFILYQNYPNPFNPTTIIKFSVPVLSSPHVLGGDRLVSLKIYNILGKEVATLVNEKLKPGEYESSFDGSNLPSGIYFYSLYADGKMIDTKKMVLLK